MIESETEVQNTLIIVLLCNYPAIIYLFMCEICSKLTIKTPERRH